MVPDSPDECAHQVSAMRQGHADFVFTKLFVGQPISFGGPQKKHVERGVACSGEAWRARTCRPATASRRCCPVSSHDERTNAMTLVGLELAAVGSCTTAGLVGISMASAVDRNNV